VSKTLEVHNRQQSHPVNCRLLQTITRNLLIELLKIDPFELEINILAEADMTQLNETFLRHRGSTDVLAFDNSEASQERILKGEIFVCADEAAIQARRFRTTWQSELIRYVIHGILHLIGYDDHRAASRRKMKQCENRVLRKLARRFDFTRLSTPRPNAKQKSGPKNIS
jgi:probable rRNA maturation factor